MRKHRDLLVGALGALLATVLLGAVPLALRTDGIQFPDGSVQTTAARARTYYLTPLGDYNGAQALGACDPGFHMATLPEIFDTATLEYDTVRGKTDEDSGMGPPHGSGQGWIRTGVGGLTLQFAGLANCDAWTSSMSDHYGTIVNFSSDWEGQDPHKVISPWNGIAVQCHGGQHVWCVED